MMNPNRTGQSVKSAMDPTRFAQTPKYTDTLQKPPSQLYPSAGWNFEAFGFSGNSNPSPHQPNTGLRPSEPPSIAAIASTFSDDGEPWPQESFPPPSPSQVPSKRPGSPSGNEQSSQKRRQPELHANGLISQISEDLFFEAPENQVKVSAQQVQQSQQSSTGSGLLFLEQHHGQSGQGAIDRPMVSDPRIESLKFRDGPHFPVSSPFLAGCQRHIGATIQQQTLTFPYRDYPVPHSPFEAIALEQQGHYSEPQQRNIDRPTQEQRRNRHSPNGSSELGPARMQPVDDASFQSLSTLHQSQTPKPKVLGPPIWSQDTLPSSIPPEIRIGSKNRYINVGCKYPPPSPKTAYIRSVSMAPKLYMQLPNSSTPTVPQIASNRPSSRAANTSVPCTPRARSRSNSDPPQTPQYGNARSTVEPLYNDKEIQNMADVSDMNVEDVLRRSRLSQAKRASHTRADPPPVKTMLAHQSIDFKPRGQAIPVKIPAPAPNRSSKIPQDSEIINLDTPNAPPQYIRDLITPPKKPAPKRTVSKKPTKVPKLSPGEEKALDEYRRQARTAEVILRKEFRGASEARDLEFFGEVIGESEEVQKSRREAKEAEAREKREARESAKLAERKRAVQVLEEKKLAKEKAEREKKLLKEREEESKRIQRDADRRRLAAEEKARADALRLQTALDIAEKRRKEDEATIQRERERIQALENEKTAQLIIQLRAQQAALAKEVNQLKASNLHTAKKVSQGSRGPKQSSSGSLSNIRARGQHENNGGLFVSDDGYSSTGELHDSDTTAKTSFREEPLDWPGRNGYRHDREKERCKKIPPILEARREKMKISHPEEPSGPEVKPSSYANRKTKADKVKKKPRQPKTKAKSKLPGSNINFVASQILNPPSTQSDTTTPEEYLLKASSQVQNGGASQESLLDRMYAPSTKPAPIPVETRVLTHAEMEEVRKQAQEDEETMQQKRIDDSKARRAENAAKKSRSKLRVQFVAEAQKCGVAISETELAEKIENVMAKRAADAKRRKEREARKAAIENFEDDALSSLVPKPLYETPGSPELNLNSGGNSDSATQSRIRNESSMRDKIQARKIENASYAQSACKTSVFHLDNLEADDSEEDPDSPELTEKYRAAAKAGQAAVVTAATSEHKDEPVTQFEASNGEREAAPSDLGNPDDFDPQIVTPFRGQSADHAHNQSSEPHPDHSSFSTGTLFGDEHETVVSTSGARNEIYLIVQNLTWHDGSKQEKRDPNKAFSVLEMANREACKLFLELTAPITNDLDDIEQHSDALGPQLRSVRDDFTRDNALFQVSIEPGEEQLRWMMEYAEIEVRVEEQINQQSEAEVET